MKMPRNIIDAHKFSFANAENLKNSKICGCYFCGEIFTPDKIDSYTRDKDGNTAICPFCWVDSIIGDASGYPVTPKFLKKMGDYWFRASDDPIEVV